MEHKKKALIIATVGGFAAQFEMNNITLLLAMGYEVHSAANYREPVYSVREQELKEMGVVLHQVDMEKSPFLWRENSRALKQLCQIIRTEKISLIHCHTPVGGLLGRLAGCLCRKEAPKVIYTAHGFHFYQGAPWRNWLFYYTAERFLARHTDILITINEEDYKRAKSFHLRSGGKAWKIPGEGLRTERFPVVTEEKRRELRRRLGLGEEEFFLLSVGELSGNKNHREMIRLMPGLQERLGEKKVIYGICGDGFYREELEEMVEEMGLQESVKLYGYQPEIADYLACADCLVFPSVREGLGMVALEAMAMGVPVAASDNRGTREYMKDGQNGYLCDVKKPESFIDAIEKISRMEPGERASMGEEGRRTAREFDLKAAAGIMSRVYGSLEEAKEPAKLRFPYPAPGENSMRKAQ